MFKLSDVRGQYDVQGVNTTPSGTGTPSLSPRSFAVHTGRGGFCKAFSFKRSLRSIIHIRQVVCWSRPLTLGLHAGTCPCCAAGVSMLPSSRTCPPGTEHKNPSSPGKPPLPPGKKVGKAGGHTSASGTAAPAPAAAVARPSFAGTEGTHTEGTATATASGGRPSLSGLPHESTNVTQGLEAEPTGVTGVHAEASHFTHKSGHDRAVAKAIAQAQKKDQTIRGLKASTDPVLQVRRLKCAAPLVCVTLIAIKLAVVHGFVKGRVWGHRHDKGCKPCLEMEKGLGGMSSRRRKGWGAGTCHNRVASHMLLSN